MITARSIGNLGISSAAGNRSAGTTAFSSWYRVSWMSGSRERWYKAQDSVLEVWGSGAPGGVKELSSLVPSTAPVQHQRAPALVHRKVRGEGQGARHEAEQKIGFVLTDP